MPRAADYADWIVEYCAGELGAPTDAMSLEKQLYYAQSFKLALSGEPLFHDAVEAWTYGPVIRNVWNRYGGSSSAPIKHKPFLYRLGQTVEPEKKTKDFLSEIVGFFGQLNAIELSRATHVEDPWLIARNDVAPKAHSNAPINPSDMQAYYTKLIDEGEDALSRRGLLANLPSPRWGWMYVAGIFARKMYNHPFYHHGLAVWGAKANLGEPPPDRGEVDKRLYKPLTKAQSEDIEYFASARDFMASLENRNSK